MRFRAPSESRRLLGKQALALGLATALIWQASVAQVGSNSSVLETSDANAREVTALHIANQGFTQAEANSREITVLRSQPAVVATDVISREVTVLREFDTPLPLDAISRELAVLRSFVEVGAQDAVSRELSVLNEEVVPLISLDAVSREISVLDAPKGIAISDAMSREVSVLSDTTTITTVADCVSRELSVLSAPVTIAASDAVSVKPWPSTTSRFPSTEETAQAIRFTSSGDRPSERMRIDSISQPLRARTASSRPSTSVMCWRFDYAGPLSREPILRTQGAEYRRRNDLRQPVTFSDGIVIDRTTPVAMTPIGTATSLLVTRYTLAGSDNQSVTAFRVQVSTDSIFASVVVDTTLCKVFRFRLLGNPVLHTSPGLQPSIAGRKRKPVFGCLYGSLR